jgi:hypothetical protein
MWVASIALGYVGFSKYFSALDEIRSPLDISYLTLQLFTAQSGALPSPLPLELQIARFLAPAMTLYTALQVVVTIFDEQLQMLRIRFVKNHVVVCGLGRKGFLLCHELTAKGHQVVVIDHNQDNHLLKRCREIGAFTLTGNAADPGVLRMARVHRARYVISVCGDDGANAEAAVHVRKLVSGRKETPLTCIVHVYDLQLCSLLKELEMKMGKLDPFRLEFFNVYEYGARVLLDEHDPFRQDGQKNHLKPHIVVVGIGRMGKSVIVNAARRWRHLRAGDERLRVTMVDKNAEREKQALYLRYPQLRKVCDLVCHEIDAKDAKFEEAGFLSADPGYSLRIVYLCLDNDSTALAAGLTLHQKLRASKIPIVVRMTYDAGLGSLLHGEKDKPEGFDGIYPFGLLDHTCTSDLIFRSTYEILARAIHKEYVRSEREKGFTPETNPAMVSWEELPEDLKESNRAQAEHIRVKLETIGCDIIITTDWEPSIFKFSPEEVELMAKMEHERFVKERLRAGWKIGPVKDIQKKISPTLIPWEELPDEEKEKDRMFVRKLPAFLADAGFQILRRAE